LNYYQSDIVKIYEMLNHILIINLFNIMILYIVIKLYFFYIQMDTNI